METINGRKVHWQSDQPYNPDAIYNLSTCSDGGLFPSQCDHRAFSPQSGLDTANRSVMPVMGFRLFYGLWQGHGVVEFLCPGRITRKVLRAIRDHGITELWSSTFTGKLWLLRGQITETIAQADCKPVQTTRAALAWSGALTGHSYGVVLTSEELAGEQA